MKSLVVSLFLSLFCLIVSNAWADDICADRPSKSSNPCTVDPGHFQLETDILNVSVQKVGGATTTTTLITDPTIKYGLTGNSDIEFSMVPETIVTVEDHGKTSTETGIGDFYARMKFEVVNDSKFQMAISPYVKLPTANHFIGNGAFEGGLSAPSQYTINKDWGVNFVPEVDALKDASVYGYHFNTSEVLSVNRNLPHKLNLTVEVWTDYNADPRQQQHQYSGDLALSWTPRSDVEFDGGVNFGLNRQTPGVQFYVGFAKHF